MRSFAFGSGLFVVVRAPQARQAARKAATYQCVGPPQRAAPESDCRAGRSRPRAGGVIIA